MFLFCLFFARFLLSYWLHSCLSVFLSASLLFTSFSSYSFLNPSPYPPSSPTSSINFHLLFPTSHPPPSALPLPLPPGGSGLTSWRCCSTASVCPAWGAPHLPHQALGPSTPTKYCYLFHPPEPFQPSPSPSLALWSPQQFNLRHCKLPSLYPSTHRSRLLLWLRPFNL